MEEGALMLDIETEKLVKLFRLYRETVALADICIANGSDITKYRLDEYWAKREELNEYKKKLFGKN